MKTSLLLEANLQFVIEFIVEIKPFLQFAITFFIRKIRLQQLGIYVYYRG